jgi:hypothetical protein
MDTGMAAKVTVTTSAMANILGIKICGVLWVGLKRN